MRKRKLFSMTTALFMVILVFTGCSEGAKSKGTDFNYDKDITVVARDAASGTRGAFHEIMGIIQKEEDTEIDKLVTGALEFDTTDKVVTAVEGDKYGIGYISLGSVSSRIKAVSVDGVELTVENVKSGEYKVSRPFILVTKGTETDLVKDFLSFVGSKQGQDIAEEMNYISTIDEPAEYKGSGKSGTIKVAGSTSVTPLMEKWQEAYFKLNPDVIFEMQSNGSSQGITAVIDGSYDVGMSSRELKYDEASQLNRYVLAIDGIAVVVNNENPVGDLSSDVVTSIYTGGITKWPQSK